MVGSIYQPLVTILPGDPAVKPLLAKEWNIKEGADGTVITFTLDEKAKFASGAAVTADDVVYSWGRIVDLNKSPAFLFTDFGQLNKDNLRAIDPQTVELTLPKTTSPQVFMTVVSYTLAAVVDKKLLQVNLRQRLGLDLAERSLAAPGRMCSRAGSAPPRTRWM